MTAGLRVSIGSPADFGKVESAEQLDFGALVALLTAAPWHAGKLTLADYQALAAGNKDEKKAAKADKATRWFSLATFTGRRLNANVTSVAGFVGDFDECDENTVGDIRVKLAGVVHLVYSTFSNSEDAPKYRLVIPYAVPVSAADHTRMFRYFNGAAMFNGALDKAASDEARLSYFPSHCADQADAAEFAYQREGAYFDAAAVLATLAPLPPKAAKSTELTAASVWPVVGIEAVKHRKPRFARMLAGERFSDDDSDHDLEFVCYALEAHGGNGQATLEWLQAEHGYRFSAAKAGRMDWYLPRTILKAFDRLSADRSVNVKFDGALPADATTEPPARVPGNIPAPPPVTVSYEPTLVRAADIKLEAIDWVWLYWLALGKLHVIAGGKSDGKSTLLLKLGATITRGGLWPDGTRCDDPGYLVIWSGEDGVADTLVPRLKLMDADMSRVFILYGAKQPDGTYAPFNPATDIALIDAQVAKLTGGPVFLMIDPILSVVAGDMHRANEVRAALKPTVDLAAKRQLIAVGVTHFTKGTKGSNPLERVLGSQAFAALARVVLVTAKDDENNRRVLMRAGSNIGPSTGGFAYSMAIEPVPGLFDRKGKPVSHARIEWGEAIEGNAREILGEIEGAGDEGKTKGDKLLACADAMRAALCDADGTPSKLPLPSNAIKDALKAGGYKDWTIREARKHLGVLITKAASGDSCWQLPQNITQAAAMPGIPK